MQPNDKYGFIYSIRSKAFQITRDPSHIVSFYFYCIYVLLIMLFVEIIFLLFALINRPVLSIVFDCFECIVVKPILIMSTIKFLTESLTDWLNKI